MTPAVDVTNIHVRYGDITALTGATLHVMPGRICGLIGMNGSGKSTLFKTIMGITPHHEGTISINGSDSAIARRNGLIGYVPQNEDVDWTFPISVRDVVMMGRYGHQGFTRRPRPVDHAAVDDALARVDLTDLAHRQIGNLSGGQRKRAFVARGIAQEARILLLDEPFAGVDKRSETTIVNLLKNLASSGVAVIVSTHDLHALPALADEAALLLRRTLFHGPVTEALRPENLTRAFGLDTLQEQW
ncbi:metal ABC transporter ATP-binding protein [Dermatophilus congolensis]|uniref:metal ABC transporter ATP-binding protein n=1 Tax=Dermatophilus congolensis TaxID=1863 RepID=UPI001AAF58E1|nr:metal ABC transporter ATP-binding protein [Dermatophilus congolensis]MBO3129180.1 metal ABC transporter ATP-binding protein [Dermatophilus congolensis]MBO3132186.1 metal ABC transporter ATP-binding protein [Dermatophilus congolensis]MBO3133658.1 metal ABC transporter ATP-binding protein [Dermatophilus congolensis]MBO3135891.1 metal ABC transporter ATP-binding protein [Dermatophilus congolensis]MBO3138130.1 metal ABC transporter ATP-binding protein [Dermatophilus congolensis]